MLLGAIKITGGRLTGKPYLRFVWKQVTKKFSADYLAYSLVDFIVDQYFVVLENNLLYMGGICR